MCAVVDANGNLVKDRIKTPAEKDVAKIVLVATLSTFLCAPQMILPVIFTGWAVEHFAQKHLGVEATSPPETNIVEKPVEAQMEKAD